MSDSYRKPSPPKQPASRRGVVVRRADDPRAASDSPASRRRIARGSDATKRAQYAEQSAQVAAELVAARRGAAIVLRWVGLGMVLFAAGGLVILRDYAFYRGPIVRSGRVEVLVALGLALGPYLLVFGAGGASSPAIAPPWYRAGAAAAVGAALLWLLTGGFDSFVRWLALHTT